ncbi:hypothetical protein Q1695_015602 [Nippostrongylus brasiliensis]|nr:hypothetical protein Q1695_015602 [Nippostrongylus brasiliensis]
MRSTIVLLAIIFCAQACSSKGGKGPVQASIDITLTNEVASGTYVEAINAAVAMTTVRKKLAPSLADGRFGDVTMDVVQDQNYLAINIQFSNADCNEVKDFFKKSTVLKDAKIKC